MTETLDTLRANGRRLRALLPAWAWTLVFIGLAVLYPYVLDAVKGAPIIGGGDDLLDASIQTLGLIIMALGLNIVVGFAGLLDLGYVAFYAIGAFVIGWLGSQQFPKVNHGKGIHILTQATSAISHQPIPGIHVNFFIVIGIAAGFTAIWGIVLGAPTLRLRGDYLAIVTLAFGEIVPRVFENSTSGIFGIGSTDFSNGRRGITPVDKINFPWSSTPLKYPLELKPVYWVALGMVLLTILISRRLRESRLGRAWIAVREDEVAAAAMGVNLVRTKLLAYAIGAAFGGFAGVFLGTYNNVVNVDQFEFGFSVFVLCMVIIGGMGNLPGVILGAVALSMMNRYGLPKLNALPHDIGLNFDVTQVNYGIFGLFMLAMMVLRPEGMLPSRRRKLELHEQEGGAERAASEPEEPGELVEVGSPA
jgi:branched-chain amino acid transport system permease protein